jgi:hypothetical protein
VLLLQGLELLATVLLARNRQLPLTVTAGVPHAGFASELISLPSGLLAMVCEAIVKHKVLLTVACVRACVRVCIYAAWAIREGRRGPGACTSPVRVGQGQCSPVGGVRPYGEYSKYYYQ